MGFPSSLSTMLLGVRVYTGETGLLLLLLSDSFGSAHSSDGSLHLNTHGESKRNGWMGGSSNPPTDRTHKFPPF